MPFCLREASCASAFCFAFGAIWRRWRSIARVLFQCPGLAPFWREVPPRRARNGARLKAAADESATDLAKLVWLILLAAAHDAAL